MIAGLVIWIPAIVGCGILTARGIFPRNESSPPLSVGTWGLLGILAILMGASFLNFFLPLGNWYGVACGVVGYVSLGFHQAELRERCSRFTLVSAPVLFLLLGLTTLFQDIVYDAGLYHLPMTLWSLQSPLPFGLANLNPFLGYNSLWPLFGAVAPYFLTETLVLFFFFLSLVEKTESSREASAGFLFALVALPVCFFAGLDSGAGSNSTDIPMAVYLLSSVLAFLSGQTLLTALFAAAGLTLKLSALPFVGLLLGICVVQARSFQRRKVAGLALSLLVVWGVRGWWVSGCFAYPEPLSCTWSVPWSVSPEMAREKVRDIKETAGNCLTAPAGERLACYSQRWLPGALRNRVLQVAGLCVVLSTAILFFSRLRRKRKRKSLSNEEQKKLKILLAVHFAGLVFWFISAPTPRFGLPYLLGGGTLLVLGALGYVGFTEISRRSVIGLLILVALFSARRIAVWNQARAWNLEQWPRFFQTETQADPLSPGTTIVVPQNDYRCGLAPQPCRTPGPYGIGVQQIGGRPFFTRNEMPR